MIRKTVALILLILFILTNSAFATSWTYFKRLESTRYGPCTEYIDADSVVNDDDRLVYWTIWVLDETLKYDGTKKIMFKKETPLVYPLQYRTLGQYLYNSTDAEIRRHTTPSDYYHKESEEISRVLEFAKPGRDSVVQPDHTVTPTPGWYAFIELEDSALYWNIHSIAAWPKDNPAIVELTVKYVWNKTGLDKRLTYLKAQKKYSAGVDGLSYTLVNYQFLLTENRGRMLSEADYDAQGKRRTLIESWDWHDIAKGSKEDQTRRIALKWLNDKESYGH
jgi:hypothetical protein